MLIECLWICSLNLHCNVISVFQIQSKIESQDDREWFADFVQRAATIPGAAAVTKTDSSGTTWSIFWIAFKLGLDGKREHKTHSIALKTMNGLDQKSLIKSLKELWSVCSVHLCYR